MVRLGKLSKWALVVVAALMLGYFTLDKIVLSPQKRAEFDGSITLSWTAPTANEDQTPLTDLAGYIIHYGTRVGHYSNTISINDPKSTSYKIEDLSPGTYYVAITAFSTDGIESALSNMAAKTVP